MPTFPYLITSNNGVIISLTSLNMVKNYVLKKGLPLFFFKIMKKEGEANFYWSHDLIGNAMLMGVGLGLFVLFIKTAHKNRNPQSL